ncbi:MAG TPA: DUF192 domain-containing protein [Pseudomonadales bacterium]|nr:DUF192 domain-containing protein [Pseudomonadales bacterium]
MQVKINDILVDVEVADTYEARQLGLMHRHSLPANSGMLFVFSECEPRQFWMKDTHIPLSIAYADELGTILNIEDMQPLNLQQTPSAGAAQYALEMNRGWFEENGIGIGHRVEMEPALLEAIDRGLLLEKQGQKSKRTLYHIGSRPAKPNPALTTRGWKTEAGWERDWLDSPVESGVFLTPTPMDIAAYHGILNHIYAYKVPEWVIEKSGGIHRFDYGSEILIPEDVWGEAGDEIEFMGKSKDKQEVAVAHDKRRAEILATAGRERDWEWLDSLAPVKYKLDGLRSTKHLLDAVKLLKPSERREAIAALEQHSADEGTWTKKDLEIADLLKRHLDEACSIDGSELLREYIRRWLMIGGER